MRLGVPAFVDDLPALDPVIAHEVTDTGWRGLTAGGEILEVSSGNGHKAAVPEGDILIMQRGTPIGRRAIKNNHGVNVSDYIGHFNRALAFHRATHDALALGEIDAAMRIAPTVRVRFNRAQILLGLGRWSEGFELFEQCENVPGLQRPRSRAAHDAGLRQWRGEPIAGKKLLLLHDHGFGDTIMCLRYVRSLRQSADVVMVMPPELARLAAQCGRVTPEIEDADYFCSMLLLLRCLAQTPHTVPPAAGYLAVDPELVAKWRATLAQRPLRPKVGIAWSIGKYHDGDYPREIPLDQLAPALDADLFSVQTQGTDEAAAVGVRTFQFEDFADCAALMSVLDEIVSVDTAALHLAGAIGHPRVTGLLSHWASWRWRDNPFYPATRLIQQQSPADWASALALL